MATTETKIVEIKVPVGDAINQLTALTEAIEKLTVETGKLDKTNADEAKQIEKNRIIIKDYQNQKRQLTNEVMKEVKTSNEALGAYQKLQNEYSKAAAKAKDLAAAQGVNSKASIDASAKANALNDKLKAIDATMGVHTRTVGDYKNQMSAAIKETINLKNVETQLEVQQKALRKAGQENTKEYRNITSAIQENKNKIISSVAEIKKNNTELKNLGLTTKNTVKELKALGLSSNEIKSQLKQMGAATDNLDNQFSKFRNGLKNTAKQLFAFAGITAIISGIGAAFRNAFNIIKTFDQAMANVNAITNATKDELKQLRDIAISLGGSTKFTASEVAGLETELGKLGFTTQQIIAATKGITMAAAATGESLQSTAMIVGSVTMAFGLNASETERVADVMAKSFSTSALDLNNFAESIKYVAPIAKQAGVSVEETAALLGVLANNGIKGSMAGTSLRKVFTDLIGTGGTLQDKIKELTKEGLNLADAKDEVGRTAMTTLMILKDNIDTIPGLTKVYQDAAGAAQEMADKQLNTVAGRITILKSTWEGFILSIENGEGRFATSLKNMIVGLINAVAGFRRLLMSDAEKVADAERNIVNKRVTDFEKYLTQQKDKEKYINQEIVAEKNLVKTKLERIKYLENEIEWRKNLGGAWDDNNKQSQEEINGLKENVSQSNAYINALGGIRKAKADETALSMQVAGIVENNQKQTTELTKEEQKELTKRNKLLDDYRDKLTKNLDELKELTESEANTLNDFFESLKKKPETLISKVTENANKILAISIKTNSAEIAADDEATRKKIENAEKVKQAKIQSYFDTANASADILQGAFNFTNALAEAELATWAKNNKGKANFDEEYAKKRAELEHKAAVRNKVMQVVNSLINTAAAVVAQLSVPGAGPALAIAAGIAGALETAAIIATPIPDTESTSYSGSSNVQSIAPDLTSKMAAPLTGSVNSIQSIGGSNTITTGAANVGSIPTFDYATMASVMAKMPAPQLSIVELKTKEKQVEFIDNISTIKS